MHRSLFLVLLCSSTLLAQDTDRDQEIQRGSQTAKGGFQNENDIRNKFNAWQTDKDAQAWLAAMGYRLTEIKSLKAEKPHGHKSDVEVQIRTAKTQSVQGISIKLVSNPNGFNQIDKRWLKTYAEMWKMPDNVVSAMKLYLGETPPVGKTKRPNRMYLSELPAESRDGVVGFFRKHKDQIIADLLAGDGEHSAKWFMVTLKSKTGPPRWTIRSMKDTIRFYSMGPVVMTSRGNLKLGRISMQRKGGDNGRPTANMLQFKMNPVQLFELETEDKTPESKKNANLRAMYVDGLSQILGDAKAKSELLNYVKSHKLDVLLLYDLHLVLDKASAIDRGRSERLARFIATAKTDYGVQAVAAIGEHAGFFADVIDPYNDSRKHPKEKFDIYNLEFEFWIASRIKDVYYEPYLKPNKLPRNEDGAFAFFLATLKTMRDLAKANAHPIQTEAYIGWTDKLANMTAIEVERAIAQHVDRLRVHAYRRRPDFGYTAQRLRGLGAGKLNLPVSIIFSAEPEFMSDWLESNGMDAAETEFRKQLSESASGKPRARVRLEGFTYFAYSHSKRVPAKSK